MSIISNLINFMLFAIKNQNPKPKTLILNT